jgi:hypothetical protein
LAASFLTGCAALDYAASDRFSAYLTGGLMAPGKRGDREGSGMALLWMPKIAGHACYNVSVDGTASVTEAHLHRTGADAPWPADGPVVANLQPFRENKSSGCLDDIDNRVAVLRELRANPSAFYIDVHNSEFPGGALRGKLEPASPEAGR